MKRFWTMILSFCLLLAMMVSCTPIAPVVTIPQGENVPSDMEFPPVSSLVPTMTDVPQSSVPVTSQPAAPQISYNPHAGEIGGDGVGGAGDPYNTRYDLDFGGIADPFPRWVSEEEYEKWLENTPNSAKNLYTFFMDFQIPKERVVEFNEYYCKEISPNDYMLDPEMIDVIYSGMSVEEIYRLYALPSSVVVGRNAYAAEYFVSHSVEEIQKAGITSQKLGEKYALLAEACNTYEQAATLTKKLKALQELESKEGKEPEGLEVEAMMAEHPLGAAIWLGESSPEEWEKAGVSLESVEKSFVRMVYAGRDRRQIAAFVAGVKKVKEAKGEGSEISRDKPLFAEYPQITLRALKEDCTLITKNEIPLEKIEEYLYDILADMEDFKNIGTFMYYLQQLEQEQLSA